MDNRITIKTPALSDYERLAECIAETRGPNYYSAQYYNADYLANGSHELFTAYDDTGELAGFTGISFGLFGNERSLLTLLNIKPEFTSRGIGRELLRLSVEILKERSVKSVKGHVVTRHTAIQNVLESLGLVPTGLLYGIRDGKNASPMIDGKCMLGLYVRNISVKDVGIIYAHNEIADFIQRVYDDLNVKAVLLNQSQYSGASVLNYYYDTHDSVLFVQILECGEDIIEKLDELHARFGSSSTFTMTVLLCLDSPSAICGYEILCGAGLHFCGLDPLGEHEHAVFFSGYSQTAEMKMTLKLERLCKELDIKGD